LQVKSINLLICHIFDLTAGLDTCSVGLLHCLLKSGIFTPDALQVEVMKPRDLLFIAIVVVTVGGLYYLSTKENIKPMSAAQAQHLTAKTRSECLVCHLPEKMAALEQAHKHPGKWRDERVNCLLCHSLQQPETKKAVSFRPQRDQARSSGLKVTGETRLGFQGEKLWFWQKLN
jgi:hypothetical protein